MSGHLARLAASSLFLAVLATGCVRHHIGVPVSTPHIYSGGTPVYVSPEEELEEIKRQVRKYCYHKNDLDPSRDSPSWGHLFDGKSYERCYELKLKGRNLKKSIKRMRQASEEAAEEPQPLPDPGTVRFGNGPLEQVKQSDQ